MGAATVSAPAVAAAPSPRRRRSLLGLSAVTALVWVTASDISIALPTIGRDLGGSMDALQWAVNGYFLAGSLIIVGGRLADLYGRRLLFAIGTLMLLAGSVVAGLAGSTTMLIAGRLLEGAGAAAILPAALAIIAVEFPPDERAGAISVWIATCWGAQALGPLVGGVLVAALGWTAIFWVNIPLGLAALWLAWTSTPESSSGEAERHIDVPGLVTLVGGLFLLNFALVEADTISGSRLALYLGGAVLLIAAFIVIERRVRSPLVALSVFRGRAFNGAVLANLIANIVFGAVVFFMALYLQVALGHSALLTGALLLPATLPILALTPVGAGWARRSGPGIPILAGMVLLLIAGLMLTAMPASYAVLVIPFVILGAGIGLQITATAEVAVDEGSGAGEGVASGVYKAASMIGGSLGVAASVTIFQSRARSHFQGALGAVRATGDQLGKMLSVLTGALRPATLDGLLGTRTQQVIEDTFRAAVGNAMWLLVAAAAVGIVTSWLLLVRGAGRS